MKLTLKSEHLAALTTGELSEIIGAAMYSAAGMTCPVLNCEIFSNQLTCRC